MGGEGPPRRSAVDAGPSEREFELWRDRYPGKLTALEDEFAQAMVDRARRRRRLRRARRDRGRRGPRRSSAVIAVSASSRQARRSAEAEALRAEASKLLALAELPPRRGPDRGPRLRHRQPRAGRHRGGQGLRPAGALGSAAGLPSRRGARLPRAGLQSRRDSPGRRRPGLEYVRVWDRRRGGPRPARRATRSTPRCAHLAHRGPEGSSRHRQLPPVHGRSEDLVSRGRPPPDARSRALHLVDRGLHRPLHPDEGGGARRNRGRGATEIVETPGRTGSGAGEGESPKARGHS